MSAALFGKLPAHGDFVARGLDADTRDALDLWLSASLGAARDVLGAGFDEAYPLAPPWRFVGEARAGALAASQDAAERRFPLLLLVSGIEETRLDDAAARCEALLYEAIGGGWTADELHARASALTPDPGKSIAPRWWCADADALVRPGDRPPDLLHAMLTAREVAA